MALLFSAFSDSDADGGSNRLGSALVSASLGAEACTQTYAPQRKSTSAQGGSSSTSNGLVAYHVCVFSAILSAKPVRLGEWEPGWSRSPELRWQHLSSTQQW